MIRFLYAENIINPRTKSINISLEKLCISIVEKIKQLFREWVTFGILFFRTSKE